MKPDKSTLREEIEHRVSLLSEAMSEYADAPEKKMQYLICANERSIYSEILALISIFGVRIGYEEMLAESYTPIMCSITKEPIKLGDKVKSGSSNANGTLHFDDYTNQYVIRNEFGQHSKTTSFVKIEENFDYSVDNSKVECRPNPNKKRW